MNREAASASEDCKYCLARTLNLGQRIESDRRVASTSRCLSVPGEGRLAPSVPVHEKNKLPCMIRERWAGVIFAPCDEGT